MLNAYFLLTWSHKRPKSFFDASLQSDIYLSYINLILTFMHE